MVGAIPAVLYAEARRPCHALTVEAALPAGRHPEQLSRYLGANKWAESAIRQYRWWLLDERTFTTWTLEQVLDALDGAGAGAWAKEVRQRYLGG
jgi:hypothetical protein